MRSNEIAPRRGLELCIKEVNNLIDRLPNGNAINECYFELKYKSKLNKGVLVDIVKSNAIFEEKVVIHSNNPLNDRALLVINTQTTEVLTIAAITLNFRDLLVEDEVWMEGESPTWEHTLGMGVPFLHANNRTQIKLSIKILPINTSLLACSREQELNSIIQESKIRQSRYINAKDEITRHNNNIKKNGDDDNIGDVKLEDNKLLLELKRKPSSGITDNNININVRSKSNFDDIIKNEWQYPPSSPNTSRSLTMPMPTDDDQEEVTDDSLAAWKQTLFSLVEENELKKLNLINLSMKTIPARIMNFEFVQKLNLSFNSLYYLPDSFSDLLNLKKLNLSNNTFTEISAPIFKLTKLEKLIITRNKISDIPHEISNLVNLELLDFGYNYINTLPPTISNLTSLQVLSLNDNQITGLPREIKGLRELRYLNVKSNKLDKFINEICKLIKLVELNVSHNSIIYIPPSIKELQSLQTFHIEYNLIRYLPQTIISLQNLRFLYASHNQLVQLVHNIYLLSSIVYIDVSQNILLEDTIPPEILQNTQTKELLRFLRTNKTGGMGSFESSLILNIRNHQPISKPTSPSSPSLLSPLRKINDVADDDNNNNNNHHHHHSNLVINDNDNQSDQFENNEIDFNAFHRHPHKLFNNNNNNNDSDNNNISGNDDGDDGSSSSGGNIIILENVQPKETKLYDPSSLLASVLMCPRKSALKETMKITSLNISTGSMSYLDTRSFIELSYSRREYHDPYLADNDETDLSNVIDDDEDENDFELEWQNHSNKQIFNVPSFHVSWLDDLSSEYDVCIGGAISFGKEEEQEEEDTQISLSIDFGFNLPHFSITNIVGDHNQNKKEKTYIREGGGFKVEKNIKVTNTSSSSSPLLLYSENYIAYYKSHFAEQEHFNFIGKDPHVGPVIMSVLRLPSSKYSFIVFTQFGVSILQCVLQNAGSDNKKGKKLAPKVAKQLLTSCANSEFFDHVVLLPVFSPSFSSDLISLETIMLIKTHRIGVLFQKKGQNTIEEMISNCEEDCLPSYSSFLSFMGQRAAGDPNAKKYLSTIEEENHNAIFYSHWRDLDLIFIDSTSLEFDEFDLEQTKRRLLIDECMVLLIYQEPGASLRPSNIASQYSCVVMTIQRDEQTSNLAMANYYVSVAQREELPQFGPVINDPPLYPRSKTFRNFLFTKLVNGDRTSCFASHIMRGMRRARKRIIQELVHEYLPDPNSRIDLIVHKEDSFDESNIYYPGGLLSPRSNNSPRIVTTKAPQPPKVAHRKDSDRSLNSFTTSSDSSEHKSFDGFENEPPKSNSLLNVKISRNVTPVKSRTETGTVVPHPERSDSPRKRDRLKKKANSLKSFIVKKDKK